MASSGIDYDAAVHAETGDEVRRHGWLLVSIFIISACAISYELLVGAVASYLLGNSVQQFSLTIGVFLASMGIGAFISQWIERQLLAWFIGVELLLSAVGGISGWLLFASFGWTRVYYPVMFALIIVIGTAIGLELPLLTRFLRQFASLHRALARVLSLDYLGALLASVAFPLVLLPELGVFRTSLTVGLVNVAVALVTAVLYRHQLKAYVRFLVGGGAIASLLGAGLVFAGPIVTDLEAELYEDTVIHSHHSAYQHLVLTRHRDDLRLYLNGSLQFSSRDEYRYHEALVHPAMSAALSRERVLIIGGGDGLGLREVLRYDDVKEAVLVDLDPAVTALAQEHPALAELNDNSLADPRATVVHEDGYAYLQNSSDLFGVVLVDLPDPSREGLAKLYSVSFYELVKRHLAKGGVATTQATSPTFAHAAFWCIRTTIEATGLKATPFHTYVPAFGDWGFILFAERAIALDEIRLRVSTRFLTPGSLEALTVFTDDIAPIEVAPSTLDRPVILEHYKRSISRWE